MRAQHLLFLLSCFLVLSTSAPLDDNDNTLSLSKRADFQPCGDYNSKLIVDLTNAQVKRNEHGTDPQFTATLTVMASKPKESNRQANVRITVATSGNGYDITTTVEDGWTPLYTHSLELTPVFDNYGNGHTTEYTSSAWAPLTAGTSSCSKTIQSFSYKSVNNFKIFRRH